MDSKIVDVRILVDRIRSTDDIDILADSIETLSIMAKEDNRSVSEYVAGCLKAYNSLICY